MIPENADPITVNANVVHHREVPVPCLIQFCDRSLESS